MHTCLTGERNGYYEDFADVRQLPKAYEETFVFDGCYSRHRDRAHGALAGALAGDRFVVAIQNHDQIGNRALGDRLGTLISPAAQRLAASLMLLAPYLPLLFMGEEYGQKIRFSSFVLSPMPISLKAFVAAGAENSKPFTLWEKTFQIRNLKRRSKLPAHLVMGPGAA